MTIELPLLLALDLTGTFVFALNGALTAVHAARLDIVGILTLGMITALGGGIVRDVLIGSVPRSRWPPSGRVSTASRPRWERPQSASSSGCSGSASASTRPRRPASKDPTDGFAAATSVNGRARRVRPRLGPGCRCRGWAG